MRMVPLFPLVALLAIGFAQRLHAAPMIDIPDAPALVAGGFDEAARVVLDRDMPAASARDRGALPPDRLLAHISLVLRRSPGRQQALDRLVHDQLDPASPLFHDWITAADVPRFAPSGHDIGVVAAWLGGHGVHVDRVVPSGMAMQLSGPVRSFEAAFGVSLHALATADGEHIGPVAAPSIPAALRPVIAGVTLGNFFPRPALRRVGTVAQRDDGRWSVTGASADFTIVDKAATYEAVTPFDFYYIYHVLPLFNELVGAEGYGQSVALVEQSDMQEADFKSFYHGLFVLPDTYLSTFHPAGCADPGLTGDEVETALDAEWSSVTAAEAKIEIASCAATVNSFGVMTSFQNLIEYGTTATVLSVSYTACETLNGVGFTTMWNDLAEAGAAEGLSIVVASGDSGVAACDSPGDMFGAMYGLSVNALASSPYVTAVGGTDFGDTARHETARYWAPPSGENVYTKQTALSYVPEIVWDDSCAGSFISQYLGLSPQASCDAAEGNDPALLNLAGSGGGASVVFAKPDWQSAALLGVPNDGARDLPDVALFAGDGIWNHFYVYCMSDPAQGGHPCKYPDHGGTALLSGGGGTSFAAPAFAGLIASIASYKELNVYHKLGPPRLLGNVAPRLYQLAATQYGQALLLQGCQANLGNKTDTACIFHEVTSGDNDVFCAHNPNCFAGIVSKDASRAVPTYAAHLGYSQATGLGSVDATNLVINY